MRCNMKSIVPGTKATSSGVEIDKLYCSACWTAQFSVQTLLHITLIKDQISDFNFHGNRRPLPLGQRELDLQSALTVKWFFDSEVLTRAGPPVQMSMKLKLNAIVLYPWPRIDLSCASTCKCILHPQLPDWIHSPRKQIQIQYRKTGSQLITSNPDSVNWD